MDERVCDVISFVVLQLSQCGPLSGAACGANGRVCDGSKTLSTGDPALHIENSNVIKATYPRAGQ